MRLAVVQDSGDDLLIQGGRFSRNQCADAETAKCVRDGESHLSTVLAAGEGEHVGATLALRIDVDAAHLVGERINEVRQRARVGTEDGDLLAVGRFADELKGLIDFVEDTDRDDGAELLLVEQFHGGCHTREDGRHHYCGVGLATAVEAVGELCSLCKGIVNEFLHARRLVGFRQRRDRTALPRETNRKFGNLLAKTLRESRGYVLDQRISHKDLARNPSSIHQTDSVDKDQLDGCAALAIEAQRAKHALFDCKLDIGAW